MLARRLSLPTLIAVTAIWGTTFALVQQLTAHNPPALVIALRFSVGVLPLLPFLRADWRTWQRGLILGGLLFIGYATQTIGLQTTNADRAAFITGLNVVMVPLFAATLQRRRIGALLWGSSALAMVGIGLLSWSGGPLRIGDLWEFGCALSYAAYILYLDLRGENPAGIRPLSLAAIQVATVTVLGWLWALPDLRGKLELSGTAWLQLLYLGLIATGLNTAMQTLAQRWVGALQAALIYALEPVFASAFAFLWAGESLGVRGVLGGALVVASLVLSQLPTLSGAARSPRQSSPVRAELD